MAFLLWLICSKHWKTSPSTLYIVQTALDPGWHMLQGILQTWLDPEFYLQSGYFKIFATQGQPHSYYLRTASQVSSYEAVFLEDWGLTIEDWGPRIGEDWRLSTEEDWVLRTGDWGLRTAFYTVTLWPHFHPLRPKYLNNPHKLKKILQTRIANLY